MIHASLQAVGGAQGRISLIGHSCGGVDAVRMVDRFLKENGDPKDIAVLMLLNSAGLRSNGLFGHIRRYRRHVSETLANGSDAEMALAQKWNQLCNDPRRIFQMFGELQYIVHADIADTVSDIRAKGIPVIIANSANDTLLGSDAPLKMDSNIELPGDHSSLFSDPEQFGGLDILEYLQDAD
jgi:hypothetical protein